MKNVVIFLVLFNILNVIGQDKGREDKGIRTGLSLGCLLKNEFFEISLTHQFTYDGKEYALGYDSIPRNLFDERSAIDYSKRDNNNNRTELYGKNDIISKNLYLYRHDRDKWVIVSDIIRTDYWKISNWIKSYETYVNNVKYQQNGAENRGKNTYLPFVEISDNELLFRLLIFYGTMGKDDPYMYRWEIIKLKLDKNGKYIKK